MLAPSFEGRDPDLTEENLQSRIRGMTLMALSNKFGWIVLSTGNKSEVAVGYATLYGDTVGGYALLKDVYKTRVYDLCRWRNTQGAAPVIPEGVITKPPSAELRPDQRDDQSLPPYEVLDPILEGYIEHDRTVGELIARGHDDATVRRVATPGRRRRVQAPPEPDRGQGHGQGVRQGPPPPHHNGLPRLKPPAHARLAPERVTGAGGWRGSCSGRRSCGAGRGGGGRRAAVPRRPLPHRRRGALAAGPAPGVDAVTSSATGCWPG